jgi:integrase
MNLFFGNGIIELIRKIFNKNRQDLNSFVFSGTVPNKPIDIRSAWETAIKLSGIKDFRFHDLRHCAASLYMQLGYPLQVIGKILGHRTISMTNMYSHLILDQSIEASNRLKNFLSEEVSVFFELSCKK